MNIQKNMLESDYNFYNPLNYKKHLELISSLTPTDNRYNIHYYWRVPREFSYKQSIALKSAIVTQDLSKCKIKLWSNIDLTNNKFYKEISNYVETEIFNFEEYLKYFNINKKINFGNEVNSYLESDLFRLLCLSRYGGFYCDMDTILLKDLSILEPFEFTYHWGSTGFDGQNPFWQNNAFLKIDKNSEFSKNILDAITVLPSTPGTPCYGKDLFSFVRKYFNDYYIFPCSWFGVEWATSKINFEPFKNNGDTEIYDNIAWHWHNRWDQKIELGSKFEKYAFIVEEKFKDKNRIK